MTQLLWSKNIDHERFLEQVTTRALLELSNPLRPQRCNYATPWFVIQQRSDKR
jgi:hypothetical protein